MPITEESLLRSRIRAAVGRNVQEVEAGGAAEVEEEVTGKKEAEEGEGEGEGRRREGDGDGDGDGKKKGKKKKGLFG